MSYNLKELLSRATDKIKKDVLCSSFVFPRTESLKDDKPCMQMEVDSLDFEAILRFIDTNPEAIALSVREDLKLVVGIVKEVKEELLLDKFDWIQIYRGGLDILRIVIKGNKVGRSASLEINDYRRRVAQALTPNPTGEIVIATVLGAVVVSVVFGFVKEFFQRKN